MVRNARVNDPIASVSLLDEPNRRRLYELVGRAGEAVGRDEAATALGISRELAAFHLDRLVEAGLLATEYRRRSGRTGPGAGRPAKLYRRTEGDVIVTLPTRNYDLAADVMAEALEDLGNRGTHALEPVARKRGLAEARRLAEAAAAAGSHGPGDPETLIQALAVAGYEPETRPDGSVVLRNCPYDALALDHRDLTCGMSAAWADGLVEGLASPMTVELTPEPGRCCVLFHPRAEAAAAG
jgi:predicted ArsR family transcriptional regulator